LGVRTVGDRPIPSAAAAAVTSAGDGGELLTAGAAAAVEVWAGEAIPQVVEKAARLHPKN